VVRHATAAIEGDSAGPVRERWLRAVALHPSDRGAILGLATLTRLSYDLVAAESLYATLLPLPGGHGDSFGVYARLGQVVMAQQGGAEGKADEIASRAVDEAKAVSDTAGEIQARILLATIRTRTVGPAVAESLFQRVRDQAARDDELAGMYHCGRAEMLALTSGPAAEEAKTGAEFAARAGNARWHAACLGFIAADLQRRGQIQAALSQFSAVVAERRRLHDRSGLASTLQWRGALLTTVGWLEDAQRDLEEAAKEGRASRNASAEAWAVAGSAMVSLALSNARDASRMADSAVVLFARRGDRYGEGLAQGLRAGVGAMIGDVEPARRAYLASKKIDEQMGFWPGVYFINLALAHLAISQEDWAEAHRELEAAEKVAAAHELSSSLQSLSYHRGVLALHRGKLDVALAEFGDRASSVRKGMNSAGILSQPNWVYLYEMRMAEVFARRGDLARAEQVAKSAEEALDNWRATLNRRELRVRAYQVAEDMSDPDLGVATVIAALAKSGRVEAAFNLSERLHARALLDQLARAEGLSTIDSLTDTLVTQSTGPGHVASLAEIERVIPDEHTAMLEFETGQGNEPTTLFVVRRGATRAYVVQAVDSLAPAIGRLNSLLESGGDPRELERQVGGRLLSSAIRDLPPDVTRLTIIPDGELHRVPYDALIVDERFVIERFAVSSIPSATVALRLWQASAPNSQATVLAIGDPALPNARRSAAGDSRSVVPELESLPRLLASGREARLVARYGDRSTVLLGEEASEANLKRIDLGQYRVLHFATHARVDEASLAGTALALAPGNGEDGFVGPGELERLHLTADLVVLSACRSGGGALVRGEGIVGLAEPFIAAGARAVALTRWEIGDRSTVPFIARIYDALARGETADQALRSAKLQAIADSVPASVWAAFTVVGDPNAKVGLHPPRSYAKIWLAAVLLVALLGVGGFRHLKASRP
jgi:tetratricopeptide (TPR) repeat protein